MPWSRPFESFALSFCVVLSLLRKPSNTTWVGKWRVLRNPKFDYVFLEHVTSVVSGSTIFDFPTLIFNYFHNKIVSVQRNTHIIQIIHTVSPNNSRFRGQFLFVRRKCHAWFRSVFSSYQWCRSTLHITDFRCRICHTKFCASKWNWNFKWVR